MTLEMFALPHGIIAFVVGCTIASLVFGFLCFAGWFTYTRYCTVRVRLRLRAHNRIANPHLAVEESPDQLGGSSDNTFISNSISPSNRLKSLLVTPCISRDDDSNRPIRHNCHSRERSQSDPELRIESEVTLSIVSPTPWARKLNRNLIRRQQQMQRPQDVMSPTQSNLESTDYDEDDDDDDEDDTVSPLSTPATRYRVEQDVNQMMTEMILDQFPTDPEMTESGLDHDMTSKTDTTDLGKSDEVNHVMDINSMPLSLSSEQQEELSGGKLAITRMIFGKGPRIVYDESVSHNHTALRPPVSVSPQSTVPKDRKMKKKNSMKTKVHQIESRSDSDGKESNDSGIDSNDEEHENVDHEEEEEDEHSLAETTATMTYQASTDMDFNAMHGIKAVNADVTTYGTSLRLSAQSQLSVLDESSEQRPPTEEVPQNRDDVKSEETEDKETPRNVTVTERIKKYQDEVERMECEAKESGSSRRDSIVRLKKSSMVKIKRNLFQNNAVNQ